MDNFKVITDFQNQDKMAEIKKFPFGSLVFLNKSKSVYENYILINKILNKNDLNLIEAEFKKINKVPGIYFENKDSLKINIEFLKINNYKNAYKDIWLFYENNLNNLDEFKNIKKVETEKDLNIFLDVFNRCYEKDDPQNPYGEVVEYLDSSKNRWLKYHSSNYIQYFLAYYNNEPVAVAALTSKNKLGYISAVGSLKKVRGKGFGKLITLYSVFMSQKMGNKETFLLTEEGTYPNEFYKKIGFVSKFSTIGIYK